MEAAVALERQVAVKLGGWRFREFVQPILLPFYETSRLFYETSNNDSRECEVSGHFDRKRGIASRWLLSHSVTHVS